MMMLFLVERTWIIISSGCVKEKERESKEVKKLLKVPLLTLVKSVIIKYLTLYLSQKANITMARDENTEIVV